MHATLDRLAAQARLHVCTARQHRQPVLDQLDRLRLLPYFTTVMVTEQTADKDALIARHVPDLSARDWMLGDTGKDIQVGKALGMRTCAVLSGFLSRASLEPYGPDLILENAAAFALPPA
jgi:phosphoglycolate phosphatase